MSHTIRSEIDIQSKIRDILVKFVNKKFHGVTVTEVKMEYKVGDARSADIAVLKDDGQPLLLIETKKKVYTRTGFRSEKRFHVMSEDVLGQVFSYAAILMKSGVYTPFVATANDYQIAVFQVPQDIVNIVDWNAIRRREYGRVLTYNTYHLLREKYLLKHVKIRFTDNFFEEILDLIAGIYAKAYKFEEKRQELHWILIEDFRGFVDTLTPFILDAIAPYGKYRSDFYELVKELANQKGYAPLPEQLAREMAYILLNKIVFYKVLERYYQLNKLDPLYEKGVVKTASEYLSVLRDYFDNAVKATGDFEAIFYTGVYDNIDIVESEEVLKLFDWLIRLIEYYIIEKLGDVVGYIYEDLIPGEERHVLGQFYTPKPIAELIVKWAVRSPDDKVLDPGCGSGTFLIEAYKRLAELKLKRPYESIGRVSEDVHREILSQLFGVDINEFPAHLTAINLAMRNPRAPSSITQVIAEDFFTIQPGYRLLAPHKVMTSRGEGVAIKMIFKDFDAVVGNPPYTRWNEIPDATRNSIQRLYGDVLQQYKLYRYVTGGALPGIFVPWIIHSSRFLKEGGRIGMIISSSWLQTEYGIGFLRYLADNFKIHAIIDIAPRVFQVPLIATCIILLEKCSNEKERNENETVLLHLPARESFNVDEILEIISEAKSKGTSSIRRGLILRVVKQEKLKVISFKPIELFFNIDTIIDLIRTSGKVIRLGDVFQPSEGNTLWSIYASMKGKGAGVGGEEFYYLSEDRVGELNLTRYIGTYLLPLIESPEMLEYFTFTERDWDQRRMYILIANAPYNQLPSEIQNYIALGQTSILITKGPNRGRPVSQSSVAGIRARLGTQNILGRTVRFYGWYDLGGVIQTPIYVTYGAQYWIRFVLSKFNCALDHRILALIPKQGVSFDEMELKALLAFLNSSFTMIQAETRGRSTGGGMLELDVKPLSEFMILDVKRLSRDVVERLAQLFDTLDSEARRLGGADTAENIYGSELAKELTGRDVKEGVKGLFNTIVREIDYEIGGIMGLSGAEVEAVRSLVIDHARRRLSRAREPKPGALKGSEELPVRVSRKRKREGGTKPVKRLDEFF